MSRSTERLHTMKVRITLDLDDETREAIAMHHGETGKASYNDCSGFILTVIDAAIAEVIFDYQQQREGEAMRQEDEAAAGLIDCINENIAAIHEEFL